MKKEWIYDNHYFQSNIENTYFIYNNQYYIFKNFYCKYETIYECVCSSERIWSINITQMKLIHKQVKIFDSIFILF